MNKSEIAERAAREIHDRFVGGCVPEKCDVVIDIAAIVEWAIAESQAPQQQENLCGIAKNADISMSEDTRPTAQSVLASVGLLSKPHEIATVNNARELDAVLNQPEPNVEVMSDGSCKELGDGEPSPKVGGVYTGLRDGCEADPSGLHECGVEENHKLCVCWSCGKSWSNPEWHGAAQVSPPGELIQRVEDYRSGYSCGYSDAKNGSRMRDKDAAQLFFRIDDGIPDVSEHQLNQEEVSPPSPEPDIEAISARVHDSWIAQQLAQGFHGPEDICPKTNLLPRERFGCCKKYHVDMVPYSELTEAVKELDRATVRTVLKAMGESGAAQEVSPSPSPDAFQEAWAKYNKAGLSTGWERVGFVGGFKYGFDAGRKSAEGDTRELKAALRRIIEVRNERDKVLIIAEMALLASESPKGTGTTAEE